MTKRISALAIAPLGERHPEPAMAVFASPRGAPGMGTPESLDAIYRQHAATVTRWVAHLVGRDVEIEDIVHEVFLVVHKRLPTFRGEASITTWLYAVALRVVSDRRRARRWRRLFGLRIASDEESGALDRQHAASPSALDLLEAQEARRAIYGVLDRLSEANRAALVMFEIEGLSGQEIAEITGISLERVWTRLHRARKQFTKQFLACEGARRAEEGT